MRPLVALILWLAFVTSGCASSGGGEAARPAEAVPPAPGGAQVPPPTVALQGTTWKLAEIAGTPVIEGSAATLEFTEAGKVSGNGSCNRFFGGATIEGETITIGPQGTTRMACADAIAAQENRYLKALGQAERFEQAGEALVIHCKGMDTPLRFVRQ